MTDDWDIIGMPTTGKPLIVHSPRACAGQFCCIHNPSQHPLRNHPLHYRGHVMERICDHDVGHPDPDDLVWRERVGLPANGIHGCDGCC